jgi:hypothetical protein
LFNGGCSGGRLLRNSFIALAAPSPLCGGDRWGHSWGGFGASPFGASLAMFLFSPVGGTRYAGIE